MLPREADAAERLHAVLAVGERGIERERGAAAAIANCRRCRGRRPRARRVPHRRARELGARQHVGAAVLHALELPDRPAELHAHLRVLGRRVDAPLRDADRLGRREHRGQVAHTRRVERGQLTVRRDLDTVDDHFGESPGGVHARQLAHRAAGGVECTPDDATGAADRRDEHRREVCAQHRPQRAAHAQAVGRRLGDETVRLLAEGDGGDGLARRDAREQRLRHGLVAAALERGRREHGRQEGPGCQDAGELFDDDDQLGHAVTRSPVRLGNVQPEPTLRRELGPERRQRLAGRVEERARHRGRAVTLDPARDRTAQRVVFLGDPDRHSSLLSAVGRRVGRISRPRCGSRPRRARAGG